MLPTVHIFATCKNSNLLRATLLIFKTLRIGFPTSEVMIHIGNDSLYKNEIAYEAFHSGCSCTVSTDTIHYEWIEWLLETQKEPFIILDTDLVFHKSCEWFEYPTHIPISGRFIPTFKNEFAKSIDKARLHTSFLYFNPNDIYNRLNIVLQGYPITEFLPIASTVYPQIILYSPSTFFDTCAILYGTVGGLAFTEDQLDCYDHIQSGTLVDLVAPYLKDIDLKKSHEAIYRDLSLIKGQWKIQEAYYKKHAI